MRSFSLSMRRICLLPSFHCRPSRIPHQTSIRAGSTKAASSESRTASASSPPPSSPVRAIQAASHFTGNYLDTAWTRQFILGSLLQRFDPLPRSTTQKTALSAAANARAVEAALLDCQRVFSSIWKLPVRPLDQLSEARILRLLARYAAGEGVLSDEALEAFQDVLRRLPGAPANVTDPVQMRTLLELIRYVEPGDNLNRVAYAGELAYPPQAHAFMMELLEEARQVDGGDAFDGLRERRAGPGYAIDSATTSEVDDAIGVCVEAKTGERYFVVYVSDATVYCPFDSSLEQVTARRLTTTTYLPEGVYFMLPKPIVEAATLREDRPCRTFNVIFQIDERTGEVKNYAVAVGWLEQLRRITYDQVQEIIDKEEKTKDGGDAARSESQLRTTATDPAASAPLQHPAPAWMTPADKANLFYILHCARIRLRARLDRQRAAAAAAVMGGPKDEQQKWKGGEDEDEDEDGAMAPPTDFSLPDPLIKVKGTQVLSVTDQVVSTQDARLAVAELMIAANEVCSRVAQANHLALPFRGTRALSVDHLVAHYYSEPQGVCTPASLDTSHVFLAEAMQSSVRRLSTVTRAIYHHTPLHHAGLDTAFYTHSTSPLRRYADMLVHHQLKTWLWQQYRGRAASVSYSSFIRGAPQQFIPEHAMATLCAMISTKQERASLLQDSSTRFWILRYLEDLERTSNIDVAGASAAATGRRRRKTYLCLVGASRRVVGAPTYSRFACSSQDTSSLLSQSFTRHNSSCATQHPLRPATVLLDEPRWRQREAEFTYVSDIYLPEVQLVHTITHHRDDIRVGAVVECEVARVQPTQGVLELNILRVLSGGDERHYERLWMGALVSQLDA
ncbi:putative mitochondrial mitochondrial exoribonuclease DSS-1 [Leptomonas pyrrhocoris]|uniref:Putative mitochondrial mitochondrial exoribonuclease DSS-1 n=1 Tax=Leptomonas pyrrhocoris TaxID=157538 RepID=A0A0N0DS55_LEPPY|nr:putative mitochondrial mitochondrial exoribonuclease DSS-1 [Leptomonas pyrrhocoris]KPA75491.1 putative mitochondrial mitochondrial exoribonuclease DSS-1 [Leptomonas pyrrhocoris]|eukprot:XP_015653930.1 putative mitochondrial mitochondrial exoribonuclease DSS-1 [Leptomonas pyrrhocoris]